MNIRTSSAAILTTILGIILLGSCASKNNNTNKGYEFTTVKLGSIEKTVSASGTLNPVSTVDVLAQMSGKVEKIYVDYNDSIRKGDVLAELNTDMLRLQREQQTASVIKARANYELQQINYNNLVALAAKNLISEYELKTGKTNLDIQAAELSAAEASLKVIETEINQYAYITSPIDGIVLERNISVGQNVVEGSSSNSSSLFTLAEDLEEMQIEAKVDELDIASIRTGQNVRFTLEALPGKSYAGTVEKVHLMPVTSDNVVNYTVIVNVENKDGALLPGMTCEVEFIEEQRENVLLVPNAALRYEPTSLSAGEIADKVFSARLAGMSESEQAAAEQARQQQNAASAARNNGSTQSSGLTGLVMPSGPGMGRGAPPGNRNAPGAQNAAAAPADTMKTLWYTNGSGKLEVISVRAGISDGSNTEIYGPAATEGMQIILKEKV